MAKKQGKSRRGRTLIDSSKYRLMESSLGLDDSLTRSPEWEATAVREAFLRGGQEMAVVERVDRRHGGGLAPAPDPRSTGFGLPALTGPGADPMAIWDAAAAVRDIARKELDSLPLWVQRSFDPDGSIPKAAAKPRFENYVGMRAVLYQLGYNDPLSDVYERLTNDAKLLGHQIGGGVHELFADRVAGLDRLLNSWSPGLAARTATEIKGAYGFVPRFIAPKHGEEKTLFSLSNHALGLAVDIDAARNPHIKEPEVIAAIREGTGYDFGKSFIDTSDDVPTVDRVAQTHLVAQAASDALQSWLRNYLPVYREAERRKGIRASFAEAVVDDGVTDHNMTLLKKIHKHHKPSEVDSWMQFGVQSIPLFLAAAMVKLGFRWGNAYKSSKDGMHFELQPCGWSYCGPACPGKQHILRPNSKPRPLGDVLRALAP